MLGEGVNAEGSTEGRLGVILPLCKECEHDNLNKTPIGSSVALAACYATHHLVDWMHSGEREPNADGSAGGGQAVRAVHAG